MAQQYHKTLKIWLTEITRMAKGLYTTDPNIRTNYYANNYSMGDMLNLLKSKEEFFLDKCEIFSLIVSDVKSMEEELQAYVDKFGPLNPTLHCKDCKFCGESDLDQPASEASVACNKFHVSIFDADGTGVVFVNRKCFEVKE